MHGRLASLGILMALMGASLLIGPASADQEEGDVVAEGHILVGLQLVDSVGRFLVGGPGALPADGLHSFRFDAAGLPGIWLAATAPAEDPDLQLLALDFEDVAGRTLDAECTHQPGQHALLDPPYGEASFEPLCRVPSDAHTGRVSATVGLSIDVVVVIAAPPTN